MQLDARHRDISIIKAAEGRKQLGKAIGGRQLRGIENHPCELPAADGS